MLTAKEKKKGTLFGCRELNRLEMGGAVEVEPEITLAGNQNPAGSKPIFLDLKDNHTYVRLSTLAVANSVTNLVSKAEKNAFAVATVGFTPNLVALTDTKGGAVTLK